MTTKTIPVAQLWIWASSLPLRFIREAAKQLGISESDFLERLKRGHQFTHEDLKNLNYVRNSLLQEALFCQLINSRL